MKIERQRHYALKHNDEKGNEIMTSRSKTLIGVGLYTIPEASRLTVVPKARIRRWLYGYQRKRNGKLIKYEPLWHSQIDISDAQILGFRDLMEIKALNMFYEEGVSAQYLWKSMRSARDELKDNYPFSSKKLRTDGKKVYHTWQKDDELAKEMKTIEILSKQHNFTEFIKQSFIDIDFEDIHPIRWWIDGRDKKIVVDPHRSFGQPIDDKSGVPTAILYEAVKASKSPDKEDEEISFKKVASDFDVDIESVKRSYTFQQDRLAA